MDRQRLLCLAFVALLQAGRLAAQPKLAIQSVALYGVVEQFPTPPPSLSRPTCVFFRDKMPIRGAVHLRRTDRHLNEDLILLTSGLRWKEVLSLHLWAQCEGFNGPVPRDRYSWDADALLPDPTPVRLQTANEIKRLQFTLTELEGEPLPVGRYRLQVGWDSLGKDVKQGLYQGRFDHGAKLTFLVKEIRSEDDELNYLVWQVEACQREGLALHLEEQRTRKQGDAAKVQECAKQRTELEERFRQHVGDILNKRPQDVYFLALLGSSLENGGRYREALDCYREVVRIYELGLPVRVHAPLQLRGPVAVEDRIAWYRQAIQRVRRRLE